MAVLGISLINTVTYWLYAQDKEAAQLGNRRVPENTLHIASFLGGWPAAWLQQEGCAIKHKSSRSAKFISVQSLLIYF